VTVLVIVNFQGEMAGYRPKRTESTRL